MENINERNKRLGAALFIQRSMGSKGDSWDNYAVARDILHEELGYHGERRQPYNLDEATRDILLAHARQDAAHALSNSISLLRRISELKRLVYLLLIAVIGLAIIVMGAPSL